MLKAPDECRTREGEYSALLFEPREHEEQFDAQTGHLVHRWSLGDAGRP